MMNLSAELIKNKLGFDYNIKVYDTIDSTNTEAKRTADTQGNFAIIADRQTAGRGRLGRKFYSRSGEGLYMSFAFDCDIEGERLVLATTAASVAVWRAIKTVSGIEAEIKWVNDLYYRDRKVCGILCEAVSDCKSARIKKLIVGIGINCGDDDFPEEIRDIAGTIGRADRNALAAEVIREMEALGGETQIKRVIEDYKRHSMVLGREIVVLNTGESAKAVDIDDNGGLVIINSEGEIKTLSSGEISIRLCGNNKEKL